MQIPDSPTLAIKIMGVSSSSIIHHSSFIIHHSSSIIHHSSFIIHHPSSIIHHSSFIIHHPSFIIHHSSFIIHHSSSIIHHPSFIIHHSSFIIQLCSDARRNKGVLDCPAFEVLACVNEIDLYKTWIPTVSVSANKQSFIRSHLPDDLKTHHHIITTIRKVKSCFTSQITRRSCISR